MNTLKCNCLYTRRAKLRIWRLPMISFKGFVKFLEKRIAESLYVNEHQPRLNEQKDSYKLKLFEHGAVPLSGPGHKRDFFLSQPIFTGLPQPLSLLGKSQGSSVVILFQNIKTDEDGID